MKKKYLVAVSGGPDSMNLLFKMKNKNIVAAHVNYNYRGNDSILDEELVKAFCKKYNIELFVLNLTKSFEEKYNYIKNKQARARKIRYDFFFEIVNQNNIDEILIAHNKDDFLETAIMQFDRNPETKLFYGLEKKTYIANYVIRRPLINKFKVNIEKENIKKNIPYRIDQTNLLPIYERNKIRIFFLNKTIAEKRKTIIFYKRINNLRKPLRKKIQLDFNNWKKTNFSVNYFRNLNSENYKYYVYFFINSNLDHINLTSGKINSITSFILSNSNKNKKYVLSESAFIKKEGDDLIVESKNGNWK